MVQASEEESRLLPPPPTVAEPGGETTKGTPARSRPVKSGKGVAEERHRTRGANRVARALLRTLAALMGGFLASMLLAALRLADVPKFRNRPIWVYFCPLWAAHVLSLALHLRALQLLRKYVARAKRERVPFALTVLSRSAQWWVVGAALLTTELLLYARFTSSRNIRLEAVCAPIWTLCALLFVRAVSCRGTPPASVAAAALVAVQGAALSWKLDGKTAFDVAAGSWFAVMAPTLGITVVELGGLARCLWLHRRSVKEAAPDRERAWRAPPRPTPRRLLDRRAKGAAWFYAGAFGLAALAVVAGALCLDERQRRREILLSRLDAGTIDRGKYQSLKRSATRVELTGRRVCAAAALLSACCFARAVCVVALGLVRYYSKYVGQTSPLPLEKKTEGWDTTPDAEKFQCVPWYLGVVEPRGAEPLDS